MFRIEQPNIALQRTPLARPLTWARSWGVVAHRRSCRSVEVASGAAESRRWASKRGSRGANAGQPGIFPGSRAYFRAYFRTAGHTGQPDSRAYRAAGHSSGQPDSRTYRTAGYISGQPDIFPGNRTVGHSSGQPGISGSRTYRAVGYRPSSISSIVPRSGTTGPLFRATAHFLPIVRTYFLWTL